MPRKLQTPWLEAYLKYVSETESPPQYRLWCGILALTATLKRRVFVKRGFITIYPNQYIVLVGPPGVGKGTAMNPATDLIKKANTANFIEDRATAERIQEILSVGFPVVNSAQGFTMGQEHTACAVAPELSIFLGASDWSLQFLCTLWDKNEFTYDTKKTKSVVTKNNCFSLLGACTPDYIRKINKDSMAAVAGGFTSRTMFVFASKKGQSIAWPEENTTDLENDLVEDLRAISQLQGEMKWEKEAREVFIDFYQKNDIEVPQFETEVLVNFRARMWTHVVKNAMIYSVSEGDDLVIRKKHIDQSIKDVLEVFKSLDVTFRGVGESSLIDATDRVMRYIENRGIASRGDILRSNYRHVTDEDLTRILYTLEAMGFCTSNIKGKSMFYTYNKGWENKP